MQVPITEVGSLIEPDPVSFSFTAPGWYVLTAILILILAGLVWFLVQRKRQNRYRKTALRAVSDLQSKELAAAAWEVNKLMKRICISKYGRQTCADLTGEDWINFLNGKCKTPVFNKEAKDVYLSIYHNNPKPPQEFLQASRNWIRKHEL